MMERDIKVVLDRGATIPTRAHDLDAGYDLYSREEITVGAGYDAIFNTGVHIAIPPNNVGLIKGKSGLFTKWGIMTEGVIDSGYTGQILVKLVNTGQRNVLFKPGDKIAQLIILPIITPELKVVRALDPTSRGNNGFGSTGR